MPGLSADRPITSPSQDRLERDHFARALVEDIRRAPRGSGFVMALTGLWGEGKTSVINLVERELVDAGEAVVVHFNPWLFSGTEQLVEHFFEELIAQLQATGFENLGRVAAALGTYGRVVSPLRYLPWVGEVFRASAEIALDASQSASRPPDGARAQAAQLRNRLIELNQPILIVVDDIDRLRAEEIVDVMRLVRLVGDFPNLVYLLAFDRPRVEEALGEGAVERGRAYLEKIVQVTHALPPVRAQALTDLLSTDLSEVVGDLEQYRFDREQFQNIFYGGLRDLIATVRDVRRFINVLPATLALIEDEVELSDVLALEALRVFAPDTFAAIVERPQAFTTTHDLGVFSDSKVSSADEAHIQLALDAAGRHRAAVEWLIRHVFPAAERHLGGSNYGSDWQTTWRTERRAASANVLETYLRRRVAPSDLPARQVEAVFAAFEDADRLDELLSAMNAEQLEQTLGRLQGYERDYPGTHPEITIEVLARHGQRLPRGRRHMGDFGAGVELSRVLYRLLRNLTPEQVAAVVETTTFPDLTSHLDVIRIVGHREGSGHRLVDAGAASRLEARLAEDLLKASADEIAQERSLGPLIAFGIDQREEDTLAAVARWAANDRFVVALTAAHLRVSMANTIGEVAVRRSTQLNWPALATLLGEDVLVRRISEIDPDWVQAGFDEDTLDAWNQARRDAADPAAASRNAARWPDHDAADE